MLKERTVNLIGLIVVIVAIAAITLTSCGGDKFSGVWDVNNGEVQIEFLSDTQCIMNDDLIGGYDGVYEYEILEGNKMMFSADGETVVMMYEITDKANKKMMLDEYE